METIKLESFTQYVKDHIISNIERFEGYDLTTGEYLSEILMKEGFADGSLTHYTKKSKQYLDCWEKDCSNYYDYMVEEGTFPVNPFEYDYFMLRMVSEGVEILLSELNYNELSNVEVLTNELISEIITDVENFEGEIEFK